MKLTFRIHAVQRIFERQISQEAVEQIISVSDVINDYSDDKPYPSKLILGRVDGRTIHVVVAYNRADDEKIVVTVYEPDPGRWESDFRRKKK